MEIHGTFSCGGKVNISDWQLNKMSLLAHGELDNVLFPGRNQHLPSTGKVCLFNCQLPAPTAILHLSHFAKCTEAQLKILNRYESLNRFDLTNKEESDIDFYDTRKSICNFISYVRTYLLSLDQQCEEARKSFTEIETELDDILMALRRFFDRLREIPVSIFHYAASNLGNKCTQPEFHMYHMHLELRWLFLTIAYARTIYIRSSEVDFENLDATLRLVINDLIYVSMRIFERINLADLRTKTPYSCTCAREFWLMIQIFLENTAERTKCKTFWEYVNASLNTVLQSAMENNRTDERKTFWHRPKAKELPTSKNPELFAAWMIYNLALLHGYDSDGIYVGNTSTRVVPNYEEIDNILKGFVRKGGKDGDRDEIDEELRIMIPLVRVLFDGWWERRVQIITYLWDCFHRRLEQPFLLQSSGPWAVSIEKKSPADILKQTRDRIDESLDHSKESSYGMFLRFLGAFLKKTYDKNDSRQWNQIKGRIYSKFSRNKVHEFGEAGLYNFISLFLTLAITADTTNVCTVMLDLLPPVLHEDSNKNGSEKRSNLSWKGELAVLLLYTENSMNVESIARNFTSVVNCISCRKDENSRSMMTSFVEVLASIVTSSEKFENGEHLFIGGWIDRYILECPKNRIGALIKILVEIFDKCANLGNTRNDSGADKILDALWSNVASRVRQLVFTPAITGDNYVDIARLAVAFTVQALKNPATAKRYKHSAASLFQHFTSSANVKDVRITKSYLATIFRHDSAVEELKSQVNNFDLIIIQAWIKCCVLGQDTTQNREMRVLKNRVSSLPEIQRLLPNEADAINFEEGEQSLLTFLAALGKMGNSLATQTEQERNRLEARVRIYFGSIDKWALAPISEESKESDLAYWIYRCIGTLILCCSSMLYVKNQPSNALRILINKFVLPAEQSEQKYLKHLGKRIFSMILLGVEKLNARSDLSLQALIRDLFEAYLPLLVTEDSGNFNISESLLRCFAEATIDFACLIFEKLASSFIIVSGDNSTHKHCYLVMLILRNLVKSGHTYQSHIVELVVAICLPNIVSCFFKVHNLHPHRRHTLDIIGDISGNPYYTNNILLRNKLLDTISTVIMKFLTCNSQCVLHFLRSMVKINIEIVTSILPRIEKIVVDLEKFKRPNAASLRYSLSQLQNMIKNN